MAIEPGAGPAATADLKPYPGMPILVLWGDYVDQVPRLEACREFVAATNQVGEKAEMMVLDDVGLPGASHMLMQDKQSENWRLAGGWLDKNISR